MNNAIRIAEIVLPVLVSLFLGWFSRLRNILNRAQIDGLKAFVVTYSLPAVLFMAFAEISYGLDVLLTCLVVFAACTAMLFIGRLFRRENPLLAFLVTGFEAGMMGYSLYTLLFGAENLSVMAVAALGGDVFVFTLYMAMLKRRDGVPPAQIARETLLSPIFLAVFAGILLGATGLWNAMRGNFLGAAVGAVADFLSGPTACAILFVMGYNIEFSRESLRGAVRAAGIRLLLCAGFCVLCLLFLTWTVGMSELLRWALILLFSLPGPYVLPVFARDESDARYASSCLSLYTLLSVAMFCVIAVLAV